VSLYDAAKDAMKLARKVDNIELIQKLLDVQQQALEMQEKQHQIIKKNEDLEKEIEKISEFSKLEFDGAHQWLVDPVSPNRKYCPVCANRDRFLNVLRHQGNTQYCGTCNKAYI
jgi:hypothetical protein